MAYYNSKWRKSAKNRAAGIVTAMGALSIGAAVDHAQAHAQMPEKEVAAVVRSYDIPAGLVSTALNRLADESNARIVYDSKLTRSLRTKGLSGPHTLAEALSEILSGSGLHYELSDDGKSALIILAQSSSAMNDASPHGAHPLPPIDVAARRVQPQLGPARPAQAAARGNAPASNSLQQGMAQGFGDRKTGYAPAVTAPTTTKTDTPLLQTPISVETVTRQTMDDQQAISLGDALIGNVSGVTPNVGAFALFKVRGFVNTVGNSYKNGLMEYRLRDVDTANLQSIEVLKGPAAMLFGRGEPGGIINMTTKRPLEIPYYSIQQQVGSYGETRTTLDATGPLTKDKVLLYRFNGEYYRNDSYRDFVTGRNVFLAPTITIHPIEQFRANIDFEYQNKTWVDDYPFLPAIGNRPANIPISRYLSAPSVTTTLPDHFERKRIAYDWTYEFLPGWSLTNRLAYYNIVTRNENSFGLGVNQATGQLNRGLFLFPGYSESTFATNLDLKGKFTTGPLEHSILTGYDYFGTYLPVYPSFMSIIDPINIYAPNYSLTANIYKGLSYGTAGQKWSGVYGQDMISFLDDRVHVLLGGRYDWAETGGNKLSNNELNAFTSYSVSTTKAFSPRAGVVLQPLPWLSFYGSFTRSLGAYNPSATITQIQPFAPQRGEAFEGGVKAELLDSRLSLIMSYFDITKTNIPATDPSNLNSATNTQLIGKARSQGFEFDLTGHFNDNWSIIANYTHDDVRTINGISATPLVVFNRNIPAPGSVLPANPRNYGSLWVKYAADGDFHGWAAGAGVSVYGDSFGDYANSYVLPAYALFNGMLSYTTKIEGYNVTAQLNVKHIGNATYYPSSGSDRYSILTGTPRAFLGSLRLEF